MFYFIGLLAFSRTNFPLEVFLAITIKWPLKSISIFLNISSLEKAVEHNLCAPSDILNHTRKTIIERLKKDGSAEGGKDGMDCSLICFDQAIEFIVGIVCFVLIGIADHRTIA